jgi:hypothetical protein
MRYRPLAYLSAMFDQKPPSDFSAAAFFASGVQSGGPFHALPRAQLAAIVAANPTHYGETNAVWLIVLS